jgi:hypothetical protein
MFSAAFFIFGKFAAPRFFNLEKILIFVQPATTLMLAGVIWIVQIVHYPLFRFVGEEKYRDFHTAHMNLITYVVAPLMIAELVSALLLLFYPPINIDFRVLWIGIGSVAAIWLSTFFLQVPLHEKLAQSFDEETHKSLINTNWIRTIGWSLRAALVLWLLSRTLK